MSQVISNCCRKISITLSGFFLVAVLVHASTMSKLQKEMYPSLRQVQGWDSPLLLITTGKKNWHCLAYLITCHRGGISFTFA